MNLSPPLPIKKKKAAVRVCQWWASEEKPVRRRQKGGCLDVEVYEYVLVCLSAGVVE